MANQPKNSGPISQPALIATLFTLVVGGAFLGALYNVATTHHRVSPNAAEPGATPAQH
jgi:hypothetical protein